MSTKMFQYKSELSEKKCQAFDLLVHHITSLANLFLSTWSYVQKQKDIQLTFQTERHYDKLGFLQKIKYIINRCNAYLILNITVSFYQVTLYNLSFPPFFPYFIWYINSEQRPQPEFFFN